MSENNPTTVRLSESVQIIKDKLTPIYGLKNILSAGLLLFSRLPDSDQKKIVSEVNKMVDDGFQSTLSHSTSSIKDVLREVTEAEKQAPGTIIKIVGREDAALLKELRKALGPGPQKKRKARRG